MMQPDPDLFAAVYTLGQLEGVNNRMVRPLAVDDHEAHFWLRHVSVNVAVSLGIGSLLALYIALTWNQPGRLVLSTVVTAALVASSAMLLLPWRRIVRHRLGCLTVYVWAGVVLCFITAGVIVDGGADSPLTVLFFLPLISAAMAWRPPAVVVMGAAVVGGYVVSGITGGQAEPEQMILFAGVLVLAVVLCAGNARNRWQQVDAQSALADRLARLADHDSLTGCVNHRAFHERLHAEVDRVLRYGGSIWLLVIDLDEFKVVNDEYGHPGGDRLLKMLGDALRRATRESDVVGRIGGDEFAILSPGIDADGALLLAERVRHEIEQVDDPAPVTASVGVSGLPGFARDSDTLLRQADQALYAAKRTGRDRVVVHDRVGDNGWKGTGVE